jgi:chromosomal replication initiation ATPase DnaA
MVAERPSHARAPVRRARQDPPDARIGPTRSSHEVPRKRVVYATSEKFTNEFITDQQARSTFRRYRRIDLLLIDDIQFIADKERTRGEFFHTFNAIHDGGRS